MEGKALQVQAGGSKVSSPLIKNPSGKPVLSGQKQIIINIYKVMKAEEPEIRYVDLIQRLAKITGVGSSTIKRTISQYKKMGIVTSPNKKKIRLTNFEKLTDDQKDKIISIVKLCMEQEQPNITKILNIVNADDTLPSCSRTTLWRTLRELGFRFKKRK